MPQRTATKNVCIITTSKSPSILQSSSTSNSSIQILDPQTGSILSSSNVINDNGNSNDNGGSGSDSRNNGATIRITSGVGVHSMQPIQLVPPSLTSSRCEHLYIAYGNQQKNFNKSTSQEQENRLHLSDESSDMYAYLLVQGGGGSNSSSSSPKWKCKLPEYMTGKLIASPCGNFIVGGGKSGTCYCWSTMSATSTSTTTTTNNGESDDDDNGSELISKWIAHYRSIQSIIFSDCGSFIITGGDDGIANVWNLMDVVSSSSSSSSLSKSIHPIQTWSEHHLPITSMHALPSSRVVSTSKDKQVIIMEIFNGRTIAKIQMNSSITNVIADEMGFRLYLGSIDGTIYCIDLNAFAIATSAESASVVNNYISSNNTNDLNVGGVKTSLSGSLLEETVLGNHSGTDDLVTEGTSSPHISELRGHSSQISCLALFEEHDTINTTLLVSGSVDGSIRIWDIRSRCCIHTLYPWSTNSGILGHEPKYGKISATSVFPCSSITVIPREWIESSNDGNDSSIFSSHSNSSGNRRSSRKRKSNSNDSLANLIKPLQRFTNKELHMDNCSSNKGNGNSGFVTAFTSPIKEDKLEVLEDVGCYEDLEFRMFSMAQGPSNSNKRIRIVIENKSTNKKNESKEDGKIVSLDTKDTKGVHSTTGNDNTKDAEQKEEMMKEIAQLREEVTRWQRVNNKLLLKLQKGTIRH